MSAEGAEAAKRDRTKHMTVETYLAGVSVIAALAVLAIGVFGDDSNRTSNDTSACVFIAVLALGFAALCVSGAV